MSNRQLEQDIAQITQSVATAVDEDAVLSWYQGKAHERAHRALHAIDAALHGGAWDAQTRRRAMSALADQATARAFAETQGAGRRLTLARRARLPLGTRPLAEVPVIERSRSATARVHNALDAMRRGDLAWAPHIASYLPLLTFEPASAHERDAVRTLTRWARDFTPIAHQLAQLARPTQR